MGEPTIINAEMNSQFLNHITSYPFVSDSISQLKSSTYGQKSISLADRGYTRVENWLPYFSKPYGYVAPYVSKADTLGEEGLKRVDEKVPQLLKATEDAKGVVRSYIRVAEDGSQYVLTTYNTERGRMEGKGYVANSKAAVSTGLMLTSNYLLWLSSLLVPRTEKPTAETNGVSEEQQNGHAE